MCGANVRAITALGYTLEQINGFYKELVDLDDKCGFKYDDEHRRLVDDADRLMAEFSALCSKIKVEKELVE